MIRSARSLACVPSTFKRKYFDHTVIMFTHNSTPNYHTSTHQELLRAGGEVAFWHAHEHQKASSVIIL